MNLLDPSQYVPLNYPEVAAIRNQGCHLSSSHPRVDFTREFFCRKWGDSFNCICPPREQFYSAPAPTIPLRGVGNEMASFNYFSAPSLKMEGVDPTLQPRISKAVLKGMVTKEHCPMRDVERSYNNNSVCGPCLPQQSNSFMSTNDDFQGFDISSDLPFRVCIGEDPSASSVPTVIRTGVDRCLRPSRLRDFKSSYKENFLDFFKTKTPQQLSLYRTPLVIDNRRPRPAIPSDPNAGLHIGVNSGPIAVNARPIRWKSYGSKRPSCLVDNKPDFEVCVSGPITIPTDYEW